MILALAKKENLKLKIILSYIVNSRPTWNTWEIVSHTHVCKARSEGGREYSNKRKFWHMIQHMVEPWGQYKRGNDKKNTIPLVWWPSTLKDHSETESRMRDSRSWEKRKHSRNWSCNKMKYLTLNVHWTVHLELWRILTGYRNICI